MFLWFILSSVLAYAGWLRWRCFSGVAFGSVALAAFWHRRAKNKGAIIKDDSSYLSRGKTQKFIKSKNVVGYNAPFALLCAACFVKRAFVYCIGACFWRAFVVCAFVARQTRI